MKYLLDTNICIYIIKKKPESVIKKFSKLKTGSVAISSITLFELYYGVAKSSKPDENMIALLEFISPLEIVDFTNIDALVYGKIRRIFLEKPCLLHRSKTQEPSRKPVL